MNTRKDIGFGYILEDISRQKNKLKPLVFLTLLMILDFLGRCKWWSRRDSYLKC